MRDDTGINHSDLAICNIIKAVYGWESVSYFGGFFHSDSALDGREYDESLIVCDPRIDGDAAIDLIRKINPDALASRGS